MGNVDAIASIITHKHVKLVHSDHHRGDGILNKIALATNTFVGSMWTFVGCSLFIVGWLFLGNIVSFDKTPWPLLLTILNLPQLSIMISLQVSANLAQKVSDAKAAADHQALAHIATQVDEIAKNLDRT